jgi:hypothetical protein
VPFVIVVFAFLAVLSAIVGLVLLVPPVAPGLRSTCLLLGDALARCLRGGVARRRSLVAVIPVFVLVGDGWVSLQLSMLAGSAVYASVVKLP